MEKESRKSSFSYIIFDKQDQLVDRFYKLGSTLSGSGIRSRQTGNIICIGQDARFSATKSVIKNNMYDTKNVGVVNT